MQLFFYLNLKREKTYPNSEVPVTCMLKQMSVNKYASKRIRRKYTHENGKLTSPTETFFSYKNEDTHVIILE